MEAARGDILVFLDGDGQYDPADMLPLLAAIEDGYPFVIGSKFMGTFEQGSISRSNIWGNRFMTALINLLFKASVTDSQSGFRAISRELVKGLQLRSMQYEIETEMLCRALKAGIKVKEVPVTGKARIAGATNFRRLRNGGRVLRTILTERVTA